MNEGDTARRKDNFFWGPKLLPKGNGDRNQEKVSVTHLMIFLPAA
jgi:hypothetical protein